MRAERRKRSWTLPSARLPSSRSTAWRRLVAEEAERGSRLLLLAVRGEAEAWRPSAVLAFRDALRPEIADAMSVAANAGIQTVMVTGDHPSTAATIADEAGMPPGRVVTGDDLDGWDDRELAAQLPTLRVVARATPDDKLRLVNAGRMTDRTVAVTGDGVNDAPALHRADVAVAMGSGTAVAKEAADLVLGDDSFATLMDGLREGRRIIANVQKGLVFILSTHVALLGFILLGTIAGTAQPLLPIQILWAELFIDVTTSVAFEREREEPGAMRTRPRAARPTAPRPRHPHRGCRRRWIQCLRGAHPVAQRRERGPRPVVGVHRPCRRVRRSARTPIAA